MDADRKASSKPIYGIGAVSRMFDVPISTLRSWEDRYGVIAPARTSGGQRLYSREQLEQIRFLKETIEAGAAPSEAHRLLEERLAEGTGPEVRHGPGSPALLILLADQDRYAAEFVEYFLRTEGWDVELCHDASDAADRFARMQPDVAIVELMISGGAGTDLCRRLKSTADRPILAISELVVPEAALEAGADAFMQKPLEGLELVSTVKDLLGLSAFLRPAGRLAESA